MYICVIIDIIIVFNMDSFAVLRGEAKDVSILEQNSRVSKLEILILYAAIFSLFIFAVFIDGGILMCILLPAVLAYTIVRVGYLHALLESVLIVLGYCLLAGGFSLHAFSMLVPGIAVGLFMRHGRSALQTVCAGAISYAGMEAYIYYTAMQAETQTDFTSVLMQEFTTMTEMLELPSTYVTYFTEIISMYMPAILVFGFAMLGFAVYAVTLAVLRRLMPEKVKDYPKFTAYRVPKGCLFVWILALIASMFEWGIWSVTAANLALVLSYYIMLCGISLILYWISRMRMGFGKVMTYIALFWMISLVSIGALVLGILDAFRNFKAAKRGEEDEK